MRLNMSLLISILMFVDLVVLQEIPSLSSESPKKITMIDDMNIEELLTEIGGIEKENELADDDLILEDFNEVELEEFKKRRPDWEITQYEINNGIKYIKQEKFDSTITFPEINQILSELTYHEKLMDILDTEITSVIIPEFMKANDLFYKLKDLTEKELGVNQELLDTTVQLVKQARKNIPILKTVWTTHKELERAKLLPPIGQIDANLEFASLYIEILAGKFFSEMDQQEEEDKMDQQEEEDEMDQQEEEDEMDGDGEHEEAIRQTYIALTRAQELMKSVKKREARFYRMLRTFLVEERNLIRLGINLWTDSLDYITPSVQNSPTFSKINIEEIIKEIGGLELEKNVSDDLFLENYNEKEFEEFKLRRPDWKSTKNIINHGIRQVYGEVEAKKHDYRIKQVMSEIVWHHFGQNFLEENVKKYVVPGMYKANDLFIKFKEKFEKVGINQEDFLINSDLLLLEELMDILVELVIEARENIVNIKWVWSNYRDLARAKLLHPIDVLEKRLELVLSGDYKLEDILQEKGNMEDIIDYKDAKKEELEVRRSEYDEYDVDVVEKFMKDVKIREGYFSLMLNTFLNSEKNLIRLAIDFLTSPLVDKPVASREESLPLKDDEQAERNEKLNQMRRQLISKMNINRAKIANETANATLIKPNRWLKKDSKSEDSKKGIKVEL